MSKNPLAIVILAAGEGKRMKSERPKVMHEVAGLPIINWVINAASALKPEKIVVVVGPDMKELEEAVAPHKIALQKERNGTAGALAVAMPELEGFIGDVLVLLGDVPMVRPQTLSYLVKANQDPKTGISILGMELADPTGYGRLVMDEKGHLIKIAEEKDARPEEKMIPLVNTGAICISGARLSRWLEKVDNKNAQGEYYITDLPEIAAQDGALTRVAICSDAEEMTGCNTRIDLARIERTAQNRMREHFLMEGVWMQDPWSVYFHHDTKIAAGVRIEPHVYFGPEVVVEKNVQIKAFSHLEGTQVKAGSMIGPYARLRPGAKIGKDVKIGNFVEVKKSNIGDRSKINHLAYVGDCEMGDDVNFSAGAITVNYDGFEKHKTVIGKGVMIGSNVNLVAPLSIDDGAFIAAGSTINVDVPADALSIARDTAQIRKGWAAEYRKRKAAIMKKLKKKSA